MESSKDLRKEYPSVLDRAYTEHQRYKTVDQIMSRDVVTISPESTMNAAAKIMGDKHIGSLIVIKYATPVGIVTERDLLSNVLAKGMDLKEVTVEKAMSFPLITICSTIRIKEAAQIMIRKKGRLAVFECGNLVGIVTASDLIQSLPEAPETQLNVDDFMTKEIIEFDEKTIVASAVKTMGQKRVGSVIVTSKGLPSGIFTERDILTKFLAKDKPFDVPLSSAASSPLVTGSSGISVHKAAYIMVSRHMRRLPIMKNGALIGIITARDLVEAYAK